MGRGRRLWAAETPPGTPDGHVGTHEEGAFAGGRHGAGSPLSRRGEEATRVTEAGAPTLPDDDWCAISPIPSVLNGLRKGRGETRRDQHDGQTVRVDRTLPGLADSDVTLATERHAMTFGWF